jgi:hypothetical protein
MLFPVFATGYSSPGLVADIRPPMPRRLLEWKKID